MIGIITRRGRPKALTPSNPKEKYVRSVAIWSTCTPATPDEAGIVVTPPPPYASTIVLIVSSDSSMLTVNCKDLVRASTGVTCSSIVILSSVRLKSNAMPASVAPTGTHGALQAVPRAAVSAGTVGGVDGLYT